MRSSSAANRSYSISIRLPPSTLASQQMATSITSESALAPSGLADTSPQHYHNKDLALQKYLLLHEQHESLRQHLDGFQPLRTTSPVVTHNMVASPATSPLSDCCSPTSTVYSATQPGSIQPDSSHDLHEDDRRSSMTPSRAASLISLRAQETEPGAEKGAASELAAEEAKLYGINEGIKRSLTEFLNCDAVRQDRALRTWVMCRLMETEKELRSRRRRRSAEV